MFATQINDVIHALAAFSEMLDFAEWINDLFDRHSFTKEGSDVDNTAITPSNIWQETDNFTEDATAKLDEGRITVFPQIHTDFDKDYVIVSEEIQKTNTGNAFHSENTSNYTEEEKGTTDISLKYFTSDSPTPTVTGHFEDEKSLLDTCDSFINEPNTVISHNTESLSSSTTNIESTKQAQINDIKDGDKIFEENSAETYGVEEITDSSCDLTSIVELLYTIKGNPLYNINPATEEVFEETLCILSQGAFFDHPEDNYIVKIVESILYIIKNSTLLLLLPVKYAEVSVDGKNILKIDNKMGRCVYIKSEPHTVMDMKAKIEFHCLKHWMSDCLQLALFPVECFQKVVIIDLGSCSTRAGILMDQPTLPRLFFPTVCAIDKSTGKSVYGMEALQPEVRQHSNLSFPVRAPIKITKHTIDTELLEGLFKKIFHDLQVTPSDYTVQVCLPRNLSINSQNDLVKLLLENLRVKAVSLTSQSLLTLYAHEVSTGIVVDIGDRIDVLPVVDGFIVENGITRVPHGGHRLIHHMKHSLAEKTISLSSEIDSFVVQYIIENLAYVADDFESEKLMISKYPEVVMKSVTLQPMSRSATSRNITLEGGRFEVAEGLFKPEMWGLDCPGIHHLVQKAIQVASVDARKKLAENIYVSGGVAMLPGFVERLDKEVTKLSKGKIKPKVFASNYRYHCAYIGACKFARIEAFPQVCINLEEYNRNNISSLKKFSLCF